MTVLIAAVSGSMGALARYFVSGVVQRVGRSPMPIGTAAVNLSGALFLGLIAGAGVDLTRFWVATVGFLAGFTTFSTWMIETVRLGVLPKPSRVALLNLIVMPVSGVAFAALGYYLAS